MHKLYFMRVVEKTRSFYIQPSPMRETTKDTVSYSMLSKCTFIKFMLKWTSVN